MCLGLACAVHANGEEVFELAPPGEVSEPKTLSPPVFWRLRGTLGSAIITNYNSAALRQRGCLWVRLCFWNVRWGCACMCVCVCKAIGISLTRLPGQRGQYTGDTAR